MREIMKSRICLLLAILFCSTGIIGLNAQPVDWEVVKKGVLNTSVQSPTAASLGAYGNEPVSLYTGKISPSISLAAIQANGYTLNISLNHNYNGFKPEVIPGSVGLGWSLNAGGVITRAVQSQRDEAEGGYTESNTQTIFQNLNSSSDLSFANDASGDSKPDIFYFNFNGISGSFFLDKYGDFQVDSDRALKIEWLGYSNNETSDLQNSRFIITDIDGTVYKFGNDGTTSSIDYVETIISKSVLKDNGEDYPSLTALTPTVTDESITAWYLRSITTTNGEVIDFEYQTDSYTLQSLLPYNDPKFIDRKVYTEWIRSSTDGGDQYTQVQNSDFEAKKLWVSKVSHGDRVIDITYNDPTISGDEREDFDRERQVESVTISNSSGTLINGYNFSYDYLGLSGGNRRLILKEVEPSGSSGQTRPGWKFSYNGEGSTDPLPSITTHMTDYWGYYNGVGTNDTATRPLGAYHFPTDNTDVNGVVAYVPGIDMDPNPTYSQIGLLESITYPTGGTETYQYESNRYSYISNVDNTLYDYVEVLGEEYSATFNDQNTYQDIVDPDILEIDFDFPITIGATTSGFSSTGIYPAECEIPTYQSGGGGIGAVQYIGIAYIVPDSDHSNHLQPIIISEDGCGLSVPLGNDDYKIKFTLFDEVVNQGGYGIVNLKVNTLDYWKRVFVDYRTGPGHRISSVNLSDGMSSSNDITKTYTYSDPNASGKSSGVLVTAPENNFRVDYGNEYFFYRTSGTIKPLGTTSGEHLGYGTVEEKTETGVSTFKTVYEYTTARDFADIHNVEYSVNIPDNPEDVGFLQFTSHDYGRGVLTKQTTYNSSGQKISSKTLTTNHIAHDGTTPALNKLSPRIETRKLATLSVEIANQYSTAGLDTFLIPGWFDRVEIIPTSVQYNLPIWSKLVSEENYIYEGMTGIDVTSATEYLYNSVNRQQERVTSTNSNGDEQVTKYNYAFEKYNGTGEMKEKNMLTQPYSIESWDCTNGLPSCTPVEMLKYWITWSNSITGAPTGVWLQDNSYKWSGTLINPGAVSVDPPLDAIPVLDFTQYDSRGNVIKVSDMFGTVTSYTYDVNGDYLTDIDKEVLPGPCAGTCTGQVSVVHPIMDAEYDTRGRVTKITKSGHTSTNYTYDEFSRLSTISNDAQEQVVSYAYTYTGDTFSSTNPNYLQSTSYTGVDNRTLREFFDGIGRSIQTISKRGSVEIISQQEYNDRSLPWKTWKPIERTGSSLGYESAFSTLAQSEYSDSYAYSENKYESNILNRSTEVIPPGGKTTYGSITTSYGIETVNGNDYTVSTTTDPVGNVSKTYTDGWGRTFRTVSDPTGINAITEFVYDQMNRLVEVRPPNYFAPPTGSINTDWIISYDYDLYGNLISKTSNDFGTAQYIYDDADRLRFSQDANEAAANQVAFTRYDGLGRILATGIADYSGSFSALDPNTHNSFEGTEGYQKSAYAYDEAPNTGVYPWSEFSTEIAAFTFNSSQAQGQQVADIYRFAPEPLEANVDTSGLGISGSETYQAIDTLSIGVSDALSGSNVLLKAGRAIVLQNGFTAFNGATLNAQIDPSLAGSDSVGVNSQTGANPWQLNLYNYDSEGRLAEKKTFTGSKREWDATITYTYNRLGELTIRKVEFRGETLYHHYAYNTLGELTSVTLTLDGVVDTELPEVEYTYASDGQVEKKEYQGNTVMDYTYDIQSRLTKINDPTVNTHPFSADYSYFNNGNIEEAEFNNPLAGLGSTHQRYKYTHSYDELNRLLSATYSNYNTGAWATTNAFKVDNLSYDKNGNITALRRYDDTAASIDDLGYTYSTSNRLNSIADATSETTGINWDAEDASYTYDSNGNMLSQSGKFTSMVYNEFNLPLQVNTSAGDYLKANYNGSGQRIIKEFSGGSWTFYLRDGDKTLATLNQDNELNFNIEGMGLEGQLLEGIDDDVIDVSSTINSESESNDTQATADGPIGTNTIDGTISASPYDTDWFYFNVLHEGTVSISAVTEGYSGPTVNLDWEIIKGSTSIASGNGSGSFSVTPGTYHLKLDPVQGLSLDYYDLKLTVTSFDEYATRYFLKDHLGSTRAIIDDTGNHLASYDYYPFGLEMPGRSASSASPVDNYKFTGHERDEETGVNLDYMLARGYDPAIGRFIQVDPHYSNYPSWSPYSYTFNNPLIYTDPTGMDPVCQKLKVKSTFTVCYDPDPKSKGPIANASQKIQTIKALGQFGYEVAWVGLDIVKKLITEADIRFEINKESGKQAERQVTKELRSDNNVTVLTQVRGVFEDGSYVIFDNVVLDEEGKVILVNETKFNNAKLSAQQRRFFENGESVKLVGKNAGTAKDKRVDPNEVPIRETRVVPGEIEVRIFIDSESNLILDLENLELRFINFTYSG